MYSFIEKNTAMPFKPRILVLLMAFSLQQAKAQQYVKDIYHDKIPVDYPGKLRDAYEFKDAAGLHLYIVSKFEQEKPTNKVNIFGAGYTRVNGAFVKDWSITDFSGLDVVFKYNYTKVIDIDKDGIYETIFVYELDPNDGMGSTWKLMLHYKNKKYVLRVHVPSEDDDNYNVQLDKTFDALPKSVKKYVIDYWNAIADELDLKGRYDIK